MGRFVQYLDDIGVEVPRQFTVPPQSSTPAGEDYAWTLSAQAARAAFKEIVKDRKLLAPRWGSLDAELFEPDDDESRFLACNLFFERFGFDFQPHGPVIKVTTYRDGSMLEHALNIFTDVAAGAAAPSGPGFEKRVDLLIRALAALSRASAPPVPPA